MKEFIEKFYIFVQSSFAVSQRKKLFELIWKNYSKKIYYYISNIIPFDHLYVDDIFQEIMIKIYRNLHTFNPIYPIKPWIYKITKNHCLNFLKNKKGKTVSANEIDYSKIEAAGNPEKNLIRDEISAEIHQFMNSLQAEDREIFYLRFYENIRFKNISEIMDININTIKSRVRIMKIKLMGNFR